jgi:hypothetical protein
MADLNNIVDDAFEEMKKFERDKELFEIEQKRIKQELLNKRLEEIDEIRKANEIQIEKGRIAEDLFYGNLVNGEKNEYNEEDLKRHNRLNPVIIKSKKVMTKEEKDKLKEEKAALKLRKKKIEFLNKILYRRDKLSSLIDFNDDLEWMLTQRLVKVNEIVDYSGNVIAVGKRIEFGAEGYFYVFDNRDNSFTLFKYDFENKTLQQRCSTNSEDELKAEIEKEDPVSRYGFKYRFYPVKSKVKVEQPSKEEIKEELERKHKEEMEEFDRLFGTAEEAKADKIQDSIDDEFEKLFS